LTACGGGGGGGDGPAVADGQFVDSAVSGVSYLSGDQSGVTDADGMFHYEVGKTVRFSIGDVVLGEATGKAIMTPVDLVPGATDETDPTVTNICRLVQSLDDDADPSNGIRLAAAAQDYISGTTIDFGQGTTAFESDPGVQAMMQAFVGETATMVSIDDARSHMHGTLAELSGGGGGTGGRLSNGSLNGEYGFVSYGSDEGDYASSVGVFTSDGAGAATIEELFVSSGELDSGTPTYDLGENGQLTFTDSDGTETNWVAVSSDGEVFTVVDADFSDGDVSLAMAIKKSTGLSNATLTGEYRTAGYCSDPWTVYGEIHFDGKGGGSYQQLVTTDAELDSGNFSYSVAPDGSLTVMPTGDTANYGMTNADGTVVAFVNADPSDEYLCINVGIKKTTTYSTGSLDGEYVMHSFESDPDTTVLVGTYDGDGNATYNKLIDSDGDPPGSSSGTVSVGADGRVTGHDDTTGDTSTSWVAISGDGSIFVAADTDSTEDLAIHVGLHK
jgi:hypothetical protein